MSDACRTYELTWAIREASERSRADRLYAIAEESKAVASEEPEATTAA